MTDLNRLWRLDGRVAVVTGGASGLGRAIARGFAESGASVAIVDREAQAARDCAHEVSESSGARAIAVLADASDEAQVVAGVDAIAQELGRIDVLVNGAGHNVRKPVTELSQAEFDGLLQVHVRGAFLFCRAVLPLMRERGSGSIINIASVAGHVGMAQLTGYAAAKGAIVQFTRALAIEVAPAGIRVNALAPGFVDTPLTRQRPAEDRAALAARIPLGRFAQPEEMVGAALFLASDAGSYVTGASLIVDGGWTAQ